MSDIFYLKCKISYHSLEYVEEKSRLIEYVLDESNGVYRTRFLGVDNRMNGVFETCIFVIKSCDTVKSVIEDIKSELERTVWVKGVINLTKEYGITEEIVNDEEIDFWGMLSGEMRG